MVTRKRKSPPPPPPGRRLFIKEWVKARALKPVDVADHVGIERESYHRWVREQNRITTQKMVKLAELLGCEPADLWHHPTERKSLDRLAAGLDDDAHRLAVEMVQRLAGQPQ